LVHIHLLFVQYIYIFLSCGFRTNVQLMEVYVALWVLVLPTVNFWHHNC
jgi:hypothetical protein